MTDEMTGAPSVADAVAGAESVQETIVERLERLAGLSPRDYEGVRREEAKSLDWRATALDKEITALRARAEQDNDLGFFESESWPEPVDGAALLDEITAGICRYLVMPEHGAEAVALWIIHAHAFDAWRHSPRLGVTAPEKGCGKSTLLDVLMCLVPRGVKTENLSTAAAFRMIDKYCPVLLADEFDSWLTGRNPNEELRGILNAGHAVGGRTFRCEGDTNELRAFKTFGPAALAGIGNLPSTLADRSIPIFMQRREPDEAVADFRADRAEHLRVAASKAARWAADKFDALKAADPELPPGVFNRLADNWRVLISIADTAGGRWPQLARAACVALGLKNADDTLSLREQLLSDIQSIFAEEGATFLSSKVVCDRLHVLEGQPWAEFGRGQKPITTTQLARQLKPLGIKPRQQRDGADPIRGYSLEDFEKAFSRYLPQSNPLHRYNPQKTAKNSEPDPLQAEPCVTGWNPSKPAENLDCNGVTTRNGGHGPEGDFKVEDDPEERAAIQEWDGEGRSP